MFTAKSTLTRYRLFLLPAILVATALVATRRAAAAEPVGTAMTYQGVLKQGGTPISGPTPVTLRFELYDALTDGQSVGGPITRVVTVTNGLFTTSLDFGPTVFRGDARYLQIHVCDDANCNSSTPLTPRQPLSATAYAMGLRPGAAIYGSVLGGMMDVSNATTDTVGTPFGLRGRLTHPAGAGNGLWGESAQSSGTGVFGTNTSPSGVNFGVRGSVASPTGYSAHFVGGRNYFENNVGIGAESPTARLHVKGNGSILNLEGNDHAYIQWYPDGVSAGRKGWFGYGGAADNNLTLVNEIAGASISLAPNAGNVGIGTSNPAQKLDVRGQLQVQSSVRLDAVDGPMIVRQFTPFTGGAKNGFGRWGLYMEPSALFLGVPGSDVPNQRLTLGGWVADSTREDWMTLQNGNVGIGTITPAERLQVHGGIVVDGGSGNTGSVANSLRFGAPTSGEAIASKRNAGGNVNGLDFYTAGIARMSINNGGRLGIGTTAPARLVEVQGTGNANTFLRIDSGSTNAAYAGLELCDRDTPTWEVAKDANNKFYVEEPGIGRRLTIEQGGNMTVGASAAENPRVFGRVLCVSGRSDVGSGSAAVVVHNPLSASTWTLGSTANGGIKFYHDGTGTDAVQVPVLEVYGGSDLAEPFDVAASAIEFAGGQSADSGVRPGMVVSIDPENVGKLRVSSSPYDTAVAGIISGANGVKPGLTLRQENTAANGQHPVALSGRVYCWVDADAGGSVKAGDMLTTSNTPGHAMKAADATRRQGCTIGKAMSPLTSGKGLVLVLVNLQ